MRNCRLRRLTVRMLAVGLAAGGGIARAQVLPPDCHDEGKDPIYRSRLDYDALDDALHRRLLAGPR